MANGLLPQVPVAASTKVLHMQTGTYAIGTTTSAVPTTNLSYSWSALYFCTAGTPSYTKNPAASYLSGVVTAAGTYTLTYRGSYSVTTAPTLVLSATQFSTTATTLSTGTYYIFQWWVVSSRSPATHSHQKKNASLYLSLRRGWLPRHPLRSIIPVDLPQLQWAMSPQVSHAAVAQSAISGNRSLTFLHQTSTAGVESRHSVESYMMANPPM